MNLCLRMVSVQGFIVSILNTSDQSEDVPVCLACAQAMRGKYRLVKIEPNIRFTCAIGKRKKILSSLLSFQSLLILSRTRFEVSWPFSLS